MCTTLALVAAAGNLRRLQQLLREGVEVDEADEEGITPLMAAARAGSRTTVLELVQANAALNSVDKQGKTALDYATEAAAEEVVEFMLADRSLLPFALGLLPAVQRGDAQAVQSMLTCSDPRLRGDPNQRDARGAPALHAALRCDSEAIVSCFLQQESLKINRRDRYMRTALDIAREMGQEALVGLLKKRGAVAGDDLEDMDDDDEADVRPS